jgi:ABC-type enterobactin transport system permease subunit
MTDTLLIGTPHGRFNFRLNKRPLVVGFILLALCLVVSGTALQLGSIDISSTEVLQALAGQGPDNVYMIVTQWRLPRVLMALVLGAALGMSGAIFQSLIRNPLGSPDIIGFNTGAYTGALFAIVLMQASHFEIAACAIAGGLITACVVYALSWKNGWQSFRLIIVGIGISAMLSAVNTWLMISASLESAMNAAIWGAGSLNGMSWSKGLPSATFCVLAMLCSWLLARKMNLLEMGDDSASALGIRVERSRFQLMICGVILTAAATAATGPISFIALAAPQIAKRLTRSHATSLLCSAWMGALLLLLADIIAQHAFMPRKLPVGVITVSIGGLYLIWLLLHQMRTRTS